MENTINMAVELKGGTVWKEQVLMDFFQLTEFPYRNSTLPMTSKIRKTKPRLEYLQLSSGYSETIETI